MNGLYHTNMTRSELTPHRFLARVRPRMQFYDAKEYPDPSCLGSRCWPEAIVIEKRKHRETAWTAGRRSPFPLPTRTSSTKPSRTPEPNSGSPSSTTTTTSSSLHYHYKRTRPRHTLPTQPICPPNSRARTRAHTHRSRDRAVLSATTRRHQDRAPRPE